MLLKFHFPLIINAGNNILLVDNSGLISCKGSLQISSAGVNKATISNAGNIVANTLSTSGTNGVMVGNGSAVNASIKSDGLVTCNGLTVTGNINVSSGTVSVNNINIANPYFCAGQVNGLNANKIVDNGRVGYTSSRRSTGVYWITFNTAHPNANYVTICNVVGAFCYVAIGSVNTSSSKVEIVTFNVSGVATDCNFNFIVV